MQPQIQDVLGELAEVRSRLEAERAEILTRLAGINAALGEPTRRVATRTPRKRSPYRKAPGTLEDLIVEVTTPAPLTPLEILEAVTKAGYVTTAPEPLKIIANVLARSAKLKKAGKGKFAPV